MSSPSAVRALRQAIRNIPRSYGRRSHGMPASRPAIPCTVSASLHRSFNTSTGIRAGMMPDTPDPQPPHNEPHERVMQPAVLDDDTYHEIADLFMNAVNEKAEELQENRDDVEVDYSAGVLSISFPPNGDYVLNKQPPNKQIWISSPISGPKRYDWVIAGEGMHQKEGAGAGEWIYLRDGSKLADLLSQELGLSVNPSEENMQQSTDPTE